jgi:hypothetical protein
MNLIDGKTYYTPLYYHLFGIFENGINRATLGNSPNENMYDNIASAIGIGGDVYVQFDPKDDHFLTGNIRYDPESTLVHEVAGHARFMANGTNPVTEKEREVQAVYIENIYRESMGLKQVEKYNQWDVPQYSPPKAESSCKN